MPQPIFQQAVPGRWDCLSLWGASDTNESIVQLIQSRLAGNIGNLDATRVDAAPVPTVNTLAWSLKEGLLGVHQELLVTKNDKLLQCVLEISVVLKDGKLLHFASCGRPNLLLVQSQGFKVVHWEVSRSDAQGAALLPDNFLGSKYVPSVQFGSLEFNTEDVLLAFSGDIPFHLFSDLNLGNLGQLTSRLQRANLSKPYWISF